MQKRRRLEFDEFDEEGMTDLLDAATNPPSKKLEQSPVAEEARVELLAAWIVLGGICLQRGPRRSCLHAPRRDDQGAGDASEAFYY